MIFRDWLSKQRHKAIRDFAWGVKRDKDFPRTNDLATIKQYFKDIGATEQSEQGLQTAWELFIKS